MALHTQRECLNSLQEQETIERGQRSSGISLSDCTAARHISCIAIMLDIDHAVIGGFRPVQHIEAFGIIAPREFAAVDNHSTQSRTVSPHELRHGMNHDVGAVFDRPQQNRRGDRVIDDQRHAMLVRHSRQALNVGEAAEEKQCCCPSPQC